MVGNNRGDTFARDGVERGERKKKRKQRESRKEEERQQIVSKSE